MIYNKLKSSLVWMTKMSEKFIIFKSLQTSILSPDVIKQLESKIQFEWIDENEIFEKAKINNQFNLNPSNENKPFDSLQLDSIFYNWSEQNVKAVELDLKTIHDIQISLKTTNIDVNMSGGCDLLVSNKLCSSEFLPKHFTNISFNKYIQKQKWTVQMNQAVLIVGSKYFLQLYLHSLTQLGFKKFYWLPVDELNTELSDTNYGVEIKSLDEDVNFKPQFLKKMTTESNKFSFIKNNWLQNYFKSEIIQIKNEELAQISDLMNIIITDFSSELHPEISNSISYFNFATNEAIFCDFRQNDNVTMFEEALKANIYSVHLDDFNLFKYLNWPL